MKKYIFALILGLILIPFNVDAKELNMYLFYGDGCPHCKALEEYLDEEYLDDKDINLYKYEVWKSEENQELLTKVQDITGEEAFGVPYFIVGETVIQGYSGSASEEKVDKAIKKAKKGNYKDNVGIFLGKVEGKIEIPDKEKPNYDPEKQEVEIDDNYKEETKKEETSIDIPLIGKVSLKGLSIPLIAIIIGLVDGFNPCAMWILIFLITMLFDYPDRKKMWILGITFLLTSAIVYFLFMLSFLNLAMFINKITILKLIIAIFALIFGGVNVYRFAKTKNVGCDVVDKNKRKKIITRIKDIISNKKFILSLIGIIILACSVNIIELLCSLGLPVVYTEILAYNNITGLAKVLYIALYVLFFLLDDLLVFFLAMKTLKITALSNEYSKYSHLIGGIIMIIIGLLMIFKPEWLMFNF